ncbi:MAG TPA: inositol monophosphatase family protein [Verrucomicrobiae bacterium]|jgi:myo-inositol-1(or 4)-monophosphatase|nr:inositol monophosphatase family protein [Verrucomicrobiae bacterium]
MKFEKKKALDCAVRAAGLAGDLMCRNRFSAKVINEQSQHDIKLALDVRCQKLIERTLLAKFPDSAVLGEEGVAGDASSALRWVVDPIDGTVNFTYGVPHACVSIALQTRDALNKPYLTVLGVVLDPFCDELWTGVSGGPARLNGRIIHASRRKNLEESIVAIGFSKTEKSLNENLPVFNVLVRRVRKIRMMGAAALSLAYVASGRFDAYIESGISLWDIAAAGLILECAGGEFWHQPTGENGQFRMIANNGLLRAKLEKVARAARGR